MNPLTFSLKADHQVHNSQDNFCAIFKQEIQIWRNVLSIKQLVETDGIQGFKFGNQKKNEKRSVKVRP